MSDRDQRTEKPTAQREKKARDEGRFPVSREFVAAVQFAVFTGLITALVDSWWPSALVMVRTMLLRAFDGDLSRLSVGTAIRRDLAPYGFLMLGMGGFLIAASLLTQLASTGFGLAASKLTPDLGRLNPMSNLRELPGRNRRALVEALVLLPVMLGVCWLVVAGSLEDFLRLPLMTLLSATGVVGSSLSELMWKASGAFLAWGAVDLVRQRQRFQRDLRMTKQEIKEEFKQNEGNPEVKMKIRRMRRELLRRRMMAEVPTATAVIVNPTHFAVALRYDMQGMATPKVVAKGKNYLALRIKEKALMHKVPVVENPPLAQALYKHVAVGQEIPAHLYRAVAEVLAYVFRLMSGRRPGA
ncbi:EscU/YscU/HrcU family type III secretion system export apparatus switch protein [uncultured Paludibaculum sp.]|uniref:EscU/YscU/HrcU family type III secretion system export apparatus switch protein n=1 Tax=uncultured Paludibaculum sp. TaxID=1765020 RepID=UPI002AAB8235|nr:EscU/YscU/HrcU family type III secretion system export apparatus switch protein [uncultured Paludibaculum sp.]